MAKVLEEELRYYIEHQDELVQRYNDRFVVIKGDTVLGAYDDILEALRETTKVYPLGTFFVQKCGPGKENYTQTFHSRVAFR